MPAMYLRMQLIYQKIHHNFAAPGAPRSPIRFPPRAFCTPRATRPTTPPLREGHDTTLEAASQVVWVKMWTRVMVCLCNAPVSGSSDCSVYGSEKDNSAVNVIFFR